MYTEGVELKPKSIYEFGKMVGHDMLHLAHCFGQLAVMYVHEKLDEADQRLLQEMELPNED